MTRVRTLRFIFLAIWLVWVPVGASPKVEVAGIQLVAKSYGEGFDGLRPYNSQKNCIGPV